MQFFMCKQKLESIQKDMALLNHPLIGGICPKIINDKLEINIYDKDGKPVIEHIDQPPYFFMHGFVVSIDAHILLLERIYLNKVYRGLGIGHEVINLLESSGRNQGLKKVVLTPDKDTDSRDYWLKRGFTDYLEHMHKIL